MPIRIRAVGRRRLLAGFGLGLLAGCAGTPSQRLVEGGERPAAVWVVCWFGPYAGSGLRAQDFKAAMRDRLPALLTRNGVLAGGYAETSKPLRSLDELKTLWNNRPAMSPAPSHVLVLTAQRAIQSGALPPSLELGIGQTVEYEAVLWDPAGDRLVWKASPKGSTAVTYEPTATAAVKAAALNARVDELAGSLLSALRHDHLVASPVAVATNLEGRPLR